MSPDEFFAKPNGTKVFLRVPLLGQVGTYARNVDAMSHLLRVGPEDVTEIVAPHTEAECVSFAGSSWVVIGRDGDFIGIRRGTIRLWVETKDCTDTNSGR